MKTSLAIALVLFGLYLAGCDFIGATPDVPTDVPINQAQDAVTPDEGADYYRTFHTAPADTNASGGH